MLMQEPMRYRLDDIDAARDLTAQLFYDHRITPLTRDPFWCEFSAASYGPLTIGDVSYGSSVDLQFGELRDSYGIAMPMSGDFEISRRGQRFGVTSTRAALIGPHGPTGTVGWREGGHVVTRIKIERRYLERELARHLGGDRFDVIPFSPELDLRTKDGAQWAALARYVRTSLASVDSLVAHPLVAPQLASTLVSGLLLAAQHPYRDALDADGKRPVPALIRRAADYMDNHAHEPITSTDVAAYVGASPRTLQRGFLEHLDTTPNRYLARIRMDRAHHELVVGTPDTTSVSEVATRWAFFHHGRFAARYHAEYGRTPGETLRRT